MSASSWATASGAPSVCPSWAAGMTLCGMWIARMPACWAPHTSSKSRSPTYTQRPGRRRRPPPSRRGRRGARAWSTGSRWCRRRRRPGRGRRRARTRRDATPAARSCWTARPREPSRVQLAPQRRDLRVGQRVRVPEVAVGLQQRRVVVEPGLGEQVGDGRALLVVAATAPHHLVGPVQRLGVHRPLSRGHHRRRQGHRLRVEVDVVPAGQGAAPVEDHRLEVHGRTLAVGTDPSGRTGTPGS